MPANGSLPQEAESFAKSVALRVLGVVLPLILLQTGGLLYWMGKIETQVDQNARIITNLSERYSAHVLIDAHPGQAVATRSIQADMERMRVDIARIAMQIDGMKVQLNRITPVRDRVSPNDGP